MAPLWLLVSLGLWCTTHAATITDIPDARRDLVCTPVDLWNIIVCCGGQDTAANSYRGRTQCDLYHLKNNSWTVGPTMNEGRRRHIGGTVFEDIVIMAMGQNQDNTVTPTTEFVNMTAFLTGVGNGNFQNVLSAPFGSRYAGYCVQNNQLYNIGTSTSETDGKKIIRYSWQDNDWDTIGDMGSEGRIERTHCGGRPTDTFFYCAGGELALAVSQQNFLYQNALSSSMTITDANSRDLADEISLGAFGVVDEYLYIVSGRKGTAETYTNQSIRFKVDGTNPASWEILDDCQYTHVRGGGASVQNKYFFVVSGEDSNGQVPQVEYFDSVTMQWSNTWDPLWADLPDPFQSTTQLEVTTSASPSTIVVDESSQPTTAAVDESTKIQPTSSPVVTTAETTSGNNVGDNNNNDTGSSSDSTAVVVIVVVLVVFIFCVLVVLGAVLLLRKRDKETHIRKINRLSVELDAAQANAATRNMKDIGTLQIQERLGAGNFGDVYKCIAWESVEVAAKELKGDLKDNLTDREATILSGLNNPHIVHFYGIHTNPEGRSFIITELMQKGSVLSYLREQDNLDFITVVGFCVDAAKGINYLHLQKLIHRDIAARNLLLDNTLTVKVCDFGLASFLPDDTYYYSVSQESAMPIRWSAPEALLYRKYTKASDIWSLGISLWEILTFGAVPFVALQNKELLTLWSTEDHKNVVDNNLHKPRHNHKKWTKTLRTSQKDLFEKLIRIVYDDCLNSNPKTRIESSALVLSLAALQNDIEPLTERKATNATQTQYEMLGSIDSDEEKPRAKSVSKSRATSVSKSRATSVSKRQRAASVSRKKNEQLQMDDLVPDKEAVFAAEENYLVNSKI